MPSFEAASRIGCSSRGSSTSPYVARVWVKDVDLRIFHQNLPGLREVGIRPACDFADSIL